MGCKLSNRWATSKPPKSTISRLQSHSYPISHVSYGQGLPARVRVPPVADEPHREHHQAGRDVPLPLHQHTQQGPAALSLPLDHHLHLAHAATRYRIKTAAPNARNTAAAAAAAAAAESTPGQGVGTQPAPNIHGVPPDTEKSGREKERARVVSKTQSEGRPTKRGPPPPLPPIRIGRDETNQSAWSIDTTEQKNEHGLI